MPPIPIVSGKQALKAFEHLGWALDHQSGSHMILYRKGFPTLSVPNHKELAPGLLRGLIRRAGLDVEDFLDALKLR
jgi:predicted RNA binding protein YcfA (HicA-like mRNA interferase family)